VPRGRTGRRLHHLTDHMDKLSIRTDRSSSSIERLKWKNKNNVQDWESFVDRMQDARKRLDILLDKQEVFEHGCDRREKLGEAELDNFETVPEKWQQQRRDEEEAAEYMKVIQEELERKKREKHERDAWVTSDSVYLQTMQRGSLIPDYDDDEEYQEEEEEEEEVLEEVEEQVEAEAAQEVAVAEDAVEVEATAVADVSEVETVAVEAEAAPETAVEAAVETVETVTEPAAVEAAPEAPAEAPAEVAEEEWH